MIRLACLTAVLLGPLQVAQAAEFRVYAAGAVKFAAETVSEGFTAQSGHRIVFTFDTVGALRDRVLAGDRPDVILVSRAAVDTLAGAGRVEATGRRPLGSIAFGLAFPGGAPAPDVSTAAKLREVLLAAGSIAYGSAARGATAGTHFERVLRDLGIMDQLRPRLREERTGIDAVMLVANGQAAVGVSQASEIAPIRGVRLVVDLPQEFRLSTPYEGAIVTGSESTAARAYLDYLASPAGQAALRNVGFTVP
jgi:molybdate transport system substrate-binding protein